jgi:hypothetical protein
MEKLNNEEGRQNYRRLRNKLKISMDKVKKECLDSTCDDIMECQRTGHYNLVYMKTKILVGKKTLGFKTLALKTLKGI